MKQVIEIWSSPIWEKSLPTLIHHLLHVCGGITVVYVLFVFGLPAFESHCISTGLFGAIELTTALFKKNWGDSIFDFYQYQAHWLLLFVGSWLLVPVIAAFVGGYFVILLKHYRD